VSHLVLDPINPFVHASGIRNGFRGFWDAKTDRFIVADVGGNVQATAQEDIEVIQKGGHHGWPECEGSCNNPRISACSCAKHIEPYYTYWHDSKAAAVIGGVVYRDGNFPSEYEGAYIYFDFTRFTMNALLTAGDKLSSCLTLI